MSEVPSTHAIATQGNTSVTKEISPLKTELEELKVLASHSRNELGLLVELYEKTNEGFNPETSSDSLKILKSSGQLTTEGYFVLSGKLLTVFNNIKQGNHNAVDDIFVKECVATLNERSSQHRGHGLVNIKSDQGIINEEVIANLDKNIDLLNFGRSNSLVDKFLLKNNAIYDKMQNIGQEVQEYVKDETIDSFGAHNLYPLILSTIDENRLPIIAMKEELQKKYCNKNNPVWNHNLTLKDSIDYDNKSSSLIAVDTAFILSAIESKKMKEIFGEDLQKCNQKKYQEVLNNLLNFNDYTSQREVNKILYYPTPDSLRNLILLYGASVKEKESGIGNRINNVLGTWSKESWWNKLLDETVEKYPDLLRQRLVLEKWNIDEMNPMKSNNKCGDFHKELEEFSRNNLDNKDTRIAGYAAKNISLNGLIDYLESKNVIDSNEFVAIKSLSGDHHIDFKIKDSLVTIFQNNKLGNSIEGELGILSKLEILAKEINTNKSLTEKQIKWLGGGLVGEIVSQDKISLEIVKKWFDDDSNNFAPNSPIFEVLHYRDFFECYDKESFIKAFGSSGEKFLKSLPNNEIERRNALTHNTYDRTSQFLNFVIDNKLISKQLNDIGILADYVKSYGFSESPLLIDIFYKLQKNDLEGLPKIAIESGIKTTEDLKKQFDHANLIVASDKIIDKAVAQKLNPLDVELILSLTGYSKGSSTKIDFEEIIDNLPERESEFSFGHKKVEFEINTMKFETATSLTEEEQNNYSMALEEIVEATKNPDDILELKSNLKEIYDSYSENMSFDKMPEAIKEKNKARLEDTLNKIENATDIDSLMVATLDVLKQNLGKNDKKIESIARSLFFKNILTSREKISEGFIERIKNNLDISNYEITIEKIQQLRDIYRNYLKDHAMKDEDHWSKDASEAIKKSIKLNQKLNIGGTIETLDNIDKYIRENSEIDGQIAVESIPDRGLIGELSGYIGDACYTEVFPLLQQYENLTPYKFIIKDPENKSAEVAGSCLVFEVKDKENDAPVLLVRALNLPNLENSIDVGGFVEKFFDQLTITAKERNIKKIIIAPDSGTISNYAGVTNYVIENYIKDKEPVELKGTFDFNGHDITNSCCVVREIN